MRISTACLALLITATPLAAQEGDHDHGDHHDAATSASAQPKPAGWSVRLDHPNRFSTDDVFFVDMAPGWHVTTGPAAVLYHPDSTASGTYRIESEIFLFDPGERREGYGVFFGGRDLDGPDQMYTYFLLRRDGRFMVKVRDGDGTAVVRDWTPNAAIATWESRAADAATVRNAISVDVRAADVVFGVNGTEVARVARDQLPGTDGIFGLRANHSLNLHVTGVGATP